MRCFGILVAGLWLVGCGTSPEFVDDPTEPQVVVYAEKERPASTPNVSRGLIGRWEGVGHQSDGSTWEMELDITRVDDGVCGVVHYPSLGCSGFWVCDDSSGRRLRAVEHITEGRRTCVDGVEVSLRLTRQRETVAFTAQTAEISAAGRLTRTGR